MRNEGLRTKLKQRFPAQWVLNRTPFCMQEVRFSIQYWEKTFYWQGEKEIKRETQCKRKKERKKERKDESNMKRILRKHEREKKGKEMIIKNIIDREKWRETKEKRTER